MANKKEQGFNDAELQDIMSEIENLEREYEEDKSDSVSTHIEASSNEETIAEADEAFDEAEEDNVVSFETKTKTIAKAGNNQVEFHGAGQVNFSLSFDIAGQTAQLEITEEGLVVSLDGMHLSIDEVSGCTVEMEGGVKFSVPMGGQTKSSKAA